MQKKCRQDTEEYHYEYVCFASKEGEGGLCSRNAAKIQKNTTMNTFALLVRKVKAGCAADVPPR